MPLILAIEPDRRQAAHLTTVIKRRVDAELILVGTTGDALDAIGNRVPDLVLVPALLSPQDDASLAAALRVIAAAARVQMLTIPVLGRPRAATKVGGVLSALRRGRQAAEPDGCDPGVFAEQIASYLTRAAQDRTAAAALIADDEEFAPAAAPIVVEAPPETAPEVAAPLTFAPAPEASAITTHDAFVDPAGFGGMTGRQELDEAPADDDEQLAMALDAAVLALLSEMPPPEPVAEATIEPPPPAPPEALEEAAAPEFAPQPLGEFVAEPVPAPLAAAYQEPEHPIATSLVDRDDASMRPWAAEPAAPPVMPIAAAGEMPVEAVTTTRESDWLTDEPVDDPAWPAVDELMAALDALPLAELDASERTAWKRPAITRRAGAVAKDRQRADSPNEESVRPTRDEVPERVTPSAPALIASPAPEPAAVLVSAPVPIPAASPARAEPEWVALIASLRHDVERLRTERADKPADKPDDRSAARPQELTAPVPQKAATAGRTSKKAKPVQDEWGFFDPEQCGFAALLAKLEEVTDSEDGPRF